MWKFPQQRAENHLVCLMEERKRIFLFRIRKRSFVVSKIKMRNMGSNYTVKESLFKELKLFMVGAI
jgi:hypothetical protein